MPSLFYSKKVIILICVLAILAFALAFISLLQKPISTQKTPMFSILPSSGVILGLNQTPSFTLISNQPFSTSEKVSLVSQNIGSDKQTPVDFSSKQPSSQTLVLTFNTLTTPSTLYTLTITNISTNKQLFEAQYLTNAPTPSPVPSNNPALANYLPYDTTNYTLTFSSAQNIYIFDFKYDPVSSTPLTAQYDQAKSDAIDFIKSKGVDPNSVVVDWRHS